MKRTMNVYFPLAGSIAPIFFLSVLFISGCGSSTNVKVGGVETGADRFAGPASINNTGIPQLSFCVTKGVLSNSFKHRSDTVRDDDYYRLHLADLLRRDAPFESIDTVLGDVEGRDCDVLLVPYVMIYVTPLGRVDATVSMTAMTAARHGNELLNASVSDESSVEVAAARVGRILFNAFAPGSPLHDKVSAEKGMTSEVFEAVAKKYRDAPVKPALSEEARKYKVQAEAAIGRKSFDEAAARYLDVLKIAPWWPDGYFNRALIFGEMGRYRKAIAEMRKYLQLVPGSPDARSVQDKIYEWEGLARNSAGS